MEKLSKEMILFLRKQHPPGSRIRMEGTADPSCPAERESMGTLEAIDDTGIYHIHRDNGGELELLPWEDHFMVLPPGSAVLRLYMPLIAYLYKGSNEDALCLNGCELKRYEKKVIEELEALNCSSPEEAGRGLMHWYKESDGVKEKVSSVIFTIEKRNGWLWGAAECRITEPLSPEEVSALKKYITWQASDGWGMEFGTNDIKVGEGFLRVWFWDRDDWFIQTEEELLWREQKMEKGMTLDDLSDLCALPGTPEETEWLRERLETLTAKESFILTAVQMRQPAASAADAVRQLCSLPDHTLICPAVSYEDLGKRYLERETMLPWSLHDSADLNKLGCWYEDIHPGLFVGNGYVAYPQTQRSLHYDGTNLSEQKDADWSVKLKLASDTVPEGVWLRLPDYEEMNDEPGEIRLALDALGVKTVQDCILLEARCSLPGITDLAEQYDDLDALIRDGQNLGFALDEQGQGMPHFMEKFLSALEFENCQLLREALDIVQNLECYDFMCMADLKETAGEQLERAGVFPSAIMEGYFDLEKCGSLLVTEQGYTITGDGCCIRRNEKPFLREFSEESPAPAMTMTM